MTPQQTLQSAIDIAVKNGWEHHGITDEGKMHFTDRAVVVDWLRGGRDCMTIGDLMLDHTFAKALWGKEPTRSADMYRCPGDEVGQVDTENWEHQLQQMVISEDPIAYLAANMPEEK